MSIKQVIQNNQVIYTVNMQGSVVTLLQARFEAKSDLARLYALAQDKLNELTMILRMAA